MANHCMRVIVLLMETHVCIYNEVCTSLNHLNVLVCVCTGVIVCLFVYLMTSSSCVLVKVIEPEGTEQNRLCLHVFFLYLCAGPAQASMGP